ASALPPVPTGRAESLLRRRPRARRTPPWALMADLWPAARRGRHGRENKVRWITVGGNKIVVYKEPGKVVVEDHDPPKLEVPPDVAKEKGLTQKAPHGVILRNVATNICGSDQHMVRGRTTAPPGQTLGHEITGEDRKSAGQGRGATH